jgi:hypothetical protein
MVILGATCGNSGSYTLNNSFIEGTDQKMSSTATGVTGRKLATGANETPSATYSSTINRQMIIGFVLKVAAGVSPPGQAGNPTPTNGATGVSLTADLSWTAGSGATSRDVYFGTAASPPLVSTSQTATTYDTGTMSNNTTYYWRINEKNASGTTTGILWSFTTIVAAPGQATSPTPANSATGVSITQDLSWTAGSGATSRDVYFGTAASPPQVSTSQTATTYDTGTMASLTTYYWRINEKNASGTTTGAVWNFTTADTTPPEVPTGLTVILPGEVNVPLDWNDNSEGDLAGYNVYRSETSGNGYSKLNG